LRNPLGRAELRLLAWVYIWSLKMTRLYTL
jgi:hypothetical protein